MPGLGHLLIACWTIGQQVARAIGPDVDSVAQEYAGEKALARLFQHLRECDYPARIHAAFQQADSCFQAKTRAPQDSPSGVRAGRRS